jgi:EAL domain-containing protein (putative c-di-GMP-specific phosphodiesterase class I)
MKFVVQNEEARQNALRDLGLLDTPPSESFDRITRMASRLLGAPVSTISLTDRDRQWFKSRVGVDLEEIPRAQAPCNYAITSDEVFVVPDMLVDDRFAGSLLAQAGIRFYAGAPLITRSGYGLGTLCVVDDKPRQIDQEQQQLLRDLAGMVMAQIELQNSIGRIDATSGYANQHQLFEDLEDLARQHPGALRVALLVEVVSPQQLNHGLRVLGAAYVEELIRGAAAAIRRSVCSAARLYHVGTSRCVVLLDEGGSRGWHEIAENVAAVLRRPVVCAGIPVTPAPVVGVYEFMADQVAPRDVLRRLFSAADDAREASVPVAAYNELRDRANARSFSLLNDVRDALEGKGAFTLVYQPRISAVTGSCVGVEALLRWNHPKLGNVPPSEFIPLVEVTAFAKPMTEWVLDTALAQLAAWRRAFPELTVSVNASATNLTEPDFASRVGEVLARHGLEADALELEFTESALASDGSDVAVQLDALARMGVRMAIDDFGTGYSSLSYLQKLPASVLKIDRSFVQPLPASDRDAKLVRAMIAMAHDLGYRVVAEGVESAAVAELLAGWHCDEMQGFHIARPLPAAEFERWVAARPEVPVAGAGAAA